MCLFTPMTALVVPSLQLSILLALMASPQPLICPHSQGCCLGWVRKPEGTSVETSLLFWLLLTGVNSYHKAWGMAPYVSVVMWACLALTNMEMTRSFYCKITSVFLQLTCYRTLDNLPFHQLLQVPKMLNYVWLRTHLQK